MPLETEPRFVGHWNRATIWPSDEVYLGTLESNLPFVVEHEPDIVFYLAGADPYAGDKLGRLAISIEGLRQRDECVLQYCYEHEIPIVTLMSGGYGEDISDTVEIHCNTIRVARKVFEREETSVSCAAS